MKGHANGFRGDSGKEQVIGLALSNGRQHVLGEAVQVDFLWLIVLAGGKQNAVCRLHTSTCSRAIHCGAFPWR